MPPTGGRGPHETVQTGFDNRPESHLAPAIHPRQTFRDSLLGPLAERQRTNLKRATDIVLVEDGKLIYWPRTGEQFADAAYAMARVQATLA